VIPGEDRHLHVKIYTKKLKKNKKMQIVIDKKHKYIYITNRMTERELKKTLTKK